MKMSHTTLILIVKRNTIADIYIASFAKPFTINKNQNVHLLERLVALINTTDNVWCGLRRLEVPQLSTTEREIDRYWI